MRHRLAAWLLAGVVAATVFIVSPVTSAWGDSALTVPTALSLSRTGSLSLSPHEGSPLLDHYAAWEFDGEIINAFPWTVAIFAVPVVVANDVLATVGIGQPTSSLVQAADTWGLEKITAALLSAATAMLIAELVFQRLTGRTDRWRVGWGLVAAALFAFGTSAWSTASRSLWQHGPSILLITIALLLATRLAERGRNAPDDRITAVLTVALGVITALSYTVRPTNAIIVVLFAWWSWRRRILGWYLAAVASTTAVWALYNVTQGIGAVPFYYRSNRIGLHAEFPEALAANLFSSGRGLLVFSPFVIMTLLVISRRFDHRNGDGLELLSGVAIASTWIAVSLFPHWWAGHSYGPRFMADTTAFIMVLLVPVFAFITDGITTGASGSRRNSARALVGILAALGAWSTVAHGQGAWFEATHCWNRVPHDVDDAPERIWSLSDPQLTSGLRSIRLERPC